MYILESFVKKIFLVYITKNRDNSGEIFQNDEKFVSVQELRESICIIHLKYIYVSLLFYILSATELKEITL